MFYTVRLRQGRIQLGLALLVAGVFFYHVVQKFLEPPTIMYVDSETKKVIQYDPNETVIEKDKTSKMAIKQVPYERANATFVTLARNSELYKLLPSIRAVEDRFNHKYHYDWVFLNDEEFTDEFKTLVTALVSGKAQFGKIPKEHWSYPEYIDKNKAAAVRKQMKEKKIIYGDLESYRHMCRFESGFFYRHPLMENYRWYWRVEPEIQIFCDVDYDVFKYMEENNKTYGFTISIHEFRATIETLWDETKKFMAKFPQFVDKDNFMDWISDDKGETYNLCHFWSNLEIADMDFWRGEAYTKYFDHLDRAGGFFYERWGDAPIHSLAVALFLPKSKIHYFDNIGYKHSVYTQCPLNHDFRVQHKCHCVAKDDFTFRGYSCGKQYYEKMGLTKPNEWSKFT
ncbi:alpha 1,2-mannosyltransferase 2.4.1 [Scheffersomyces spartinae]|uniref:Alpha 1,2-mannosyltransferase 2.4.1 n=1 Tax=Scheffersomyces spartinae TaxID=45513 RepID=A0A9P7VAS8_9ASCO|nr:alpha 1,2-mannosyltransferase 2.4.1 [Scheffersomyces spartinae]KAG7194345.1 alpha 1,2-mannosyltransferase 2.4.1 [Scheffersomyces spartinae]